MSRVRVCAHCVSRCPFRARCAVHFVTSYRVSVCRTPKCVALCWQVSGAKDTDTQGDVRRGTGPPYALEIQHGSGRGSFLLYTSHAIRQPANISATAPSHHGLGFAR